jgi:SAM-dependent methyltransferase
MYDERKLSGVWLIGQVKQFYKNGTRVLNVGSAGSLYAASLPRHLGIDVRKDPEPPAGSVFQQLDFLENGLPDESFDIIILYNVLQFLGTGAYAQPKYDNGWERGLLEASRLVKQDGVIIATFPAGVSQIAISPSGELRTMALAEIDAYTHTYNVHTRIHWKSDGGGYKSVEAKEIIGEPWMGERPGGVVGLTMSRPQTLPTLEELLETRPVESTPVPESNDLTPWAAQISTATRDARSFAGRDFQELDDGGTPLNPKDLTGRRT